MFRSIVLLIGALASLSAASLLAQDAVLGQNYGAGVHAYFTGDSMKAYEQLTAAIDHGSKDPRVFYFRGLAYLRLGRPQEAVTDFRKGADVESKDINRFYNVGKALERVQGADRLQLEGYRVNARMAAYEESEKLRRERYEAVKREEERVLREQAVATPEAPAGEAEVVPPPPAAESPDPFATPATGAQPAKKGTEKKGPEKKGAEAADDPFATPAAKPAAKTPAKKGSLFNAIGKAAGKAAGAKDKAADEKKPAAEKPADDSDPFGAGPGDTKKPDEKKPDAKKPAEKKPDDKKPADSTDPFGNP
jgi:hypothetical protein